MKSIQFLASLLSLVSSAVAQPYVTSISIPVNSQGTDCRPSYDNVWSVSSTINTSLGIGIIINPSFVAGNVWGDFALHQNEQWYPSEPDYLSPHVPNPASVTVKYTFDQPVAISGVRIVQHVNGITRVQGLAGNGSGPLQSLGDVFGPSGDVTAASALGPFVVSSDGVVQDFLFGNTSVFGSEFDLVITKTSWAEGFATHRIYPLDQAGNPIYAAVPEPQSAAMIVSGLVVILAARWRTSRESIQVWLCTR